MFVAITACGMAQAKQNLLGKPAPIFNGTAVWPDGSIKDFNVQNYIGQNIVIYFYPMDSSPTCTIQAKKFRDEIEKLHNNNIMVVGVSPDSINSHKKFQKALALPYPLVSDANKKHSIAKKYKTQGIFFGKRETFLINKQGIIFKIFDQIDIKNQVDDIITSFKAAL